MNRHNLNVTEMASTVSAYLNKTENKAIWQANAALLETVTEVGDSLATIAEIEKKQKAPIKGPATDKAELRYNFECDILHVAGQIAALAAKTKNATLEEQAHLSLAALDKLAVDDLTATARRISALAVANLAALAPFEITQAVIDALDDETDDFEAIKTKPREAIVDRKKETDQIPSLISDLLSTLRRRLDRQMLAYQRTQPEFYRGYIAARVIVDRGNPAKKKNTPAPPPA